MVEWYHSRPASGPGVCGDYEWKLRKGGPPARKGTECLLLFVGSAIRRGWATRLLLHNLTRLRRYNLGLARKLVILPVTHTLTFPYFVSGAPNFARSLPEIRIVKTSFGYGSSRFPVAF